MQQDKHRGLVAGVESHRIPDAARKACNGLLRNQVCGGLGSQTGSCAGSDTAESLGKRTRLAGRHTVFNGRDELKNLSEGWPRSEMSNCCHCGRRHPQHCSGANLHSSSRTVGHDSLPPVWDCRRRALPNKRTVVRQCENKASGESRITVKRFIAGLWLPQDKSWNSWRVLFLRWRGNAVYLRWTLPQPKAARPAPAASGWRE